MRVKNTTDQAHAVGPTKMLGVWSGALEHNAALVSDLSIFLGEGEPEPGFRSRNRHVLINDCAGSGCKT